MALRLPSSNSPIRQLFDVADLARPLDLPNQRDFVARAVSFLASEPAARSVNALVLRMSGDVWLIRVGPKGGVKCLFNFGDPAYANGGLDQNGRQLGIGQLRRDAEVATC